MNIKNSVLLTRTDRLGDVLMTLPSVIYLRENLPEIPLEFLCRDEYAPVVGPLLNSVGVVTTARSSFVISKRYRAVLFFFYEKHLSSLVWKTGIPIRAGIFSKPSSFMFLNSGLRQRRSKAEKNEAEYNLDLAEAFLKAVEQKPRRSQATPIELPRSPENLRRVEELLARLDVDPDRGFIVIHPGMGGSALNASAAQYREIIEQIKSRTAYEILLSVGPGRMDVEMSEAIKNVKKIEAVPLEVLMEVFRLSKGVVAPSTGPLHLAHLVGAPTFGIYPPVKSHRPLRWQPWGGAGSRRVLSPSIPCPGRKDCIGDSCRYYYCMDGVPWAESAADWAADVGANR
jgi:heptosyltransferase-3